jgi:hypothetical protein
MSINHLKSGSCVIFYKCGIFNKFLTFLRKAFGSGSVCPHNNMTGQTGSGISNRTRQANVWRNPNLHL